MAAGDSTLTSLPRLLYFGDVPVESTLAGAAVLYRLLEGYAADRLVVLQDERGQTAINQRLPGVRYETYRLPLEGLTGARFGLAKPAGIFRYLTAGRRAEALAAAIGDFNPQVVLTVAHGFAWASAAAFARQRGLPLVLIVHDDVPDMLARKCIPWILLRRIQPLVDAYPSIWGGFWSVYREAACRLCVSPQMAEAYRRWGAPAQVMYPSRAREGVAFDSPPVRALRRQSPLVFGYAGGLGQGSNPILLSTLAQMIEPDGSKLVLYTQPNPPKSAIRGSNVEFRGFTPNALLVSALRDEIDVLVLPMSFDPRDRRNMEVSFPSKLTNYTAACLPILIWGPPYCSAVRWAKSAPGLAEIVEENNRESLAAAVKSLRSDPARCIALARAAAAAGARDFDWPVIRDQFFSVLRVNVQPSDRVRHLTPCNTST